MSDLDEELEPRVVVTGLAYAIIPLRNTRTLASAWFNFDLLPEFERRYAELYPFAFTGDDEPFAEARCFSPLAGIVEDPATGSAAGPLAAYLSREGLLGPGGRGCWPRASTRAAPAASRSRWPPRARASSTCSSAAVSCPS